MKIQIENHDGRLRLRWHDGNNGKGCGEFVTAVTIDSEKENLKKVAIEIQGGIWQPRSGHNSGKGLTRDFEKLNLATSEGWRVFQLSGEMITEEWLDAIAIASLSAKPPTAKTLKSALRRGKRFSF